MYSERQPQCVSQRHIISHHYTIFIIISNQYMHHIAYRHMQWDAHKHAFIYSLDKCDRKHNRYGIGQSDSGGDCITDVHAQPHTYTDTQHITDEYSERQPQCVSQRLIISHHYTILIIISNQHMHRIAYRHMQWDAHKHAFIYSLNKCDREHNRYGIGQSDSGEHSITDVHAQPHTYTDTQHITDVYSERQPQCVSQRHIISHHYTIFIIISNQHMHHIAYRHMQWDAHKHAFIYSLDKCDREHNRYGIGQSDSGGDSITDVHAQPHAHANTDSQPIVHRYCLCDWH